MTRDVTKLQFFSSDPIDKIVASGTYTMTNDGNTLAAGGTGDGPQAAKIVQESQPHTYGKSALIRYKWSTNGSDFNAATAHLLFSFTITFTDIPVTSSPLQGLTSAVSVGCDASNIYFRTANGRHGNVSQKTTDPAASGYIPTNFVFTIIWAMYEKEL